MGYAKVQFVISIGVGKEVVRTGLIEGGANLSELNVLRDNLARLWTL